jgi:hypothetical protein
MADAQKTFINLKITEMSFLQLASCPVSGSINFSKRNRIFGK